MKRHFDEIVLLSLGAVSALAMLGLTTVIAPHGDVSVAQTLVASKQAKSLAKELQGKPVVVDIYADWCPKCKNVAPTLSSLKQKYQGKVNFVVFDVTDRGTTQAAEAKAQKLGLGNFLAANKTQTGMIAILDPSTGNVLKQFRNNPNQSDYTPVLDSAIDRLK